MKKKSRVREIDSNGMGVWNCSEALLDKRARAQKSEESQGGGHDCVAAEGTTVGKALRRKPRWGPA